MVSKDFPSDPFLSGPRRTPWFLLFCDFYWTFYLWKMTMYHRERICFHQLLAATRRRRKITKLLTLCTPISINQATLNSCAHFNQPNNFECTHPFQSTRQLWARGPLAVSKTKILSSPYFNWKFPPTPHGLGPPSSTCPNSWLYPPPSHRCQRNPHTPPPLLSMESSDAASWPQYGHLRISQTVRLKSRSQW